MLASIVGRVACPNFGLATRDQPTVWQPGKLGYEGTSDDSSQSNNRVEQKNQLENGNKNSTNFAKNPRICFLEKPFYVLTIYRFHWHNTLKGLPKGSIHS